MEWDEQPNNEPMHLAPSSVYQVLEIETKEEILERLRLQKIDSNYCISENGDSMLHAILRNGKLMERDVIEISTVLLARGVGSSVANKDEQTAFQLAVERRMRDVVNLLLTFLYDIHTVDQLRNSVAHFFIEDECEKCKVAMFYPLMNTDENRETRAKNSVNFLEFLMSKGVDFDCENKRGESALHLAVKNRLLHVLPTLLERTNNIRFVDENDKTLLHLILEGRWHSPEEHPRSDHDSKYAARIVRILLDRGVPLSISDRSSCTLISNAIKEKEQRDIIETLIDYYLHGCDDKAAATNLFRELTSTCALWSDSETDYFLTVLRDLVIKGVDINDERPQSRLWLTDSNVKNSRVVEFLKEESGLAYSVKSSTGKNLLHVLAEEKHQRGNQQRWKSCKEV